LEAVQSITIDRIGSVADPDIWLGAHHVADPDIRLGGGNLICFPVQQNFSISNFGISNFQFYRKNGKWPGYNQCK